MQTLEEVTRLVETNVGFELLKREARKKIVSVEDSLTRLLFRTSTQVDPLKIEYDRGFRQGVTYALEALPNEIIAEFKRELREIRGGVTSA